MTKVYPPLCHFNGRNHHLRRNCHVSANNQSGPVQAEDEVKG